MDLTNLGHMLIGLLLALITLVIRIQAKKLDERLTILEGLIGAFTEDIEQVTDNAGPSGNSSVVPRR